MTVAKAEVDDPDGWVADLLEAGWRELSLHVWEAPDCSLWRGPFGAWREMKLRAAKGGR